MVSTVPHRYEIGLISWYEVHPIEGYIELSDVRIDGWATYRVTPTRREYTAFFVEERAAHAWARFAASLERRELRAVSVSTVMVKGGEA